MSLDHMGNYYVGPYSLRKTEQRIEREKFNELKTKQSASYSFGAMFPSVSNLKQSTTMEDLRHMDEMVAKWKWKMNQIRNQIQQGEFNPDEIRQISKKMNELRLTQSYEYTMKDIKFGTFLANMEQNYPEVMKNPRPENMQNPHAHHILFKTGKGKEQQELVEIGQAILRKYGIDPIIGIENLVWAPNAIGGQHSVEALRKVVSTLMQVDEEMGTYEDIVEALQNLGSIASLRG